MVFDDDISEKAVGFGISQKKIGPTYCQYRSRSRCAKLKCQIISIYCLSGPS